MRTTTGFPRLEINSALVKTPLWLAHRVSWPSRPHYSTLPSPIAVDEIQASADADMRVQLASRQSFCSARVIVSSDFFPVSSFLSDAP
jgi:hypothetical protein